MTFVASFVPLVTFSSAPPELLLIVDQPLGSVVETKLAAVPMDSITPDVQLPPPPAPSCFL